LTTGHGPASRRFGLLDGQSRLRGSWVNGNLRFPSGEPMPPLVPASLHSPQSSRACRTSARILGPLFN
jgi:hypothetical protein